MPVISLTTNNKFIEGIHHEYDRIKHQYSAKTN